MASNLDRLSAVKKEVKEVISEGKKIISHFKKLEEYYDSWQERVNKVEIAIQELELETGLTKEEIVADLDIMDEIKLLASKEP